MAWFHQAYAAVGSDQRLGHHRGGGPVSRLRAGPQKGRSPSRYTAWPDEKKDLVSDIRTKNLKEAVRLLGLLPLPEDSTKREAELADRYKVLKEYERYARGLSAMSKEPAMQSVRLGLENLAVTAGFPDPVRLEWAVTAREVADLGAGPVTLTVKTVSVSLG